MNSKTTIYDSPTSINLSLDTLVNLCRDLGVKRIIYKPLSPNDNSKNQPYMGGHLTELGFLPTGNIIESQSTSGKTRDPKRKIKYTTTLDYYWLSSDGQKYIAPNAKLIYYPQYPEVRLSGFLAGARIDMGGWMDPARKGRTEGRILIFGITDTGSIYAWLALPDSRIAKEIRQIKSIPLTGIFHDIPLKRAVLATDSKVGLLTELRRIHLKGWISSKRLDRNGKIQEYFAPNGGGYTLEAELGVIPNGFAEPDYLGWEVKQFSVKKFHLINSKPLTVMTPEPDGGFYVEKGVEAFVRHFGYADTRGRANRFNFNGIHKAGIVSEKTGLTLAIVGYDFESDAISDAAGYIALIDTRDKTAMSWSFAKIMEHWKRKHAKAVYVPSMSSETIAAVRSYHYGNIIRLFEGTNISLLLHALSKGHIYYDPGIKLENANTRPVTKRRSQFRIKSESLSTLYHSNEQVDLTKVV